MKTLICYFVFALFILAGCSKDTFIGNEPAVNLKKAKVPIPSKGEMCMTDNDEEGRLAVHMGSPDGDVIPGVDIAKAAWLYGNMTHTGKLQEQSAMTGREGAYLDLEAYSEGKLVVVATYDARIYSANGDYFDVVSNIRIDVTDPDNKIITGDTNITGGSGRFENVTGIGVLSGIIPCWDIDGTIVYN